MPNLNLDQDLILTFTTKQVFQEKCVYTKTAIQAHIHSKHKLNFQV